MNAKKIRNVMLSLCLVSIIAGPFGFAQSSEETKATPGSAVTLKQAWNELFQLSQKEKKGLTFFVNGQTVPGIVTKILGEEGVEVKNQTSDRIVIRLESVDAVALN